MHLFDLDISLNSSGLFLFEGIISDNWSINGNPNGGYLMAMLANAMLQYTDKKATPIITANYIARCVPGKAEFRVEEIARSKQFSRYEARLIQDGREKIRALGTFADEKNECDLERYESAAPVLPPLEECVSFPSIPKYTHFDNIDLRLDPACAGWMQGKLTDRSEHRGWVSFKDERPYDLLSVILVVDSFPPPAFATQGPIAWVPTIELSVNIRSIPKTGWLTFTVRTRFITCGLLEADAEVWDGEGKLVAIARQIAQFRKLN